MKTTGSLRYGQYGVFANAEPTTRPPQTACLAGRWRPKRDLSAAPETSCAFGTPTTSYRGHPWFGLAIDGG